MLYRCAHDGAGGTCPSSPASWAATTVANVDAWGYRGEWPTWADHILNQGVLVLDAHPDTDELFLMADLDGVGNTLFACQGGDRCADAARWRQLQTDDSVYRARAAVLQTTDARFLITQDGSYGPATLSWCGEYCVEPGPWSALSTVGDTQWSGDVFVQDGDLYWSDTDRQLWRAKAMLSDR